LIRILHSRNAIGLHDDAGGEANMCVCDFISVVAELIVDVAGLEASIRAIQ
jgi:hypothetical protein